MMSSCAVMQFGMKKMKNGLAASPLAPSSTRNTAEGSQTTDKSSCSAVSFAAEGKENMESKSLLSKLYSRFRHKQRRHEKCEKCGQKSDTCVANPSFISGRKHYLCQDCRVSSDNVKNMFSQLRRNLSLRETRGTCNSGDLTPPSSSRGVLRSRSMRSRPAAPESGYETATSLDSCSNGRLSPDPISTSSGEGGRCFTPHNADGQCSGSQACSRVPGQCGAGHHQLANGVCAHDSAQCSRDRSEVFGGAFRSEKAHLREIQPAAKPKQKVYTRQRPAAPHHHHQTTHHQHVHQPQTHKDKAGYDGYLEITNPNSQNVKYVFTQNEGNEVQNDEAQDDHLSRRRHTVNLKLCYRCNRYRCVAFRAPFQKGWLCEDCIDDMI